MWNEKRKGALTLGKRVVAIMTMDSNLDRRRVKSWQMGESRGFNKSMILLRLKFTCTEGKWSNKMEFIEDCGQNLRYFNYCSER